MIFGDFNLTYNFHLKALDWLREKRVSDYGWENDTHFVILAKEVRRVEGKK